MTTFKAIFQVANKRLHPNMDMFRSSDVQGHIPANMRLHPTIDMCTYARTAVEIKVRTDNLAIHLADHFYTSDMRRTKGCMDLILFKNKN